MEKRPFDILCLGEPLGEFNATRGDGGYVFGLGGDVSNCAVAAARQGARVAVMGAIGADRAGDAWRATWKAEGVDDSAVVTDRNAPTGLYFVDHGPEGHVFSYRRSDSAATRFGPDRLDPVRIAGARCLHLSGISLAISLAACDLSLAAIETARSTGTLVSFDTNLRRLLWPLPRARAIIGEAARQADILLPGEDDVTALLGLEDPDRILDHYLAVSVGDPVIVLKRGRKGAVVATRAYREEIPPFKVEAIDATGAGDCFDGAFLAEYLATGDPMGAARHAAAAAALACTGWGAIAPIPTRERVAAFMNRN